jgi:hypothetical protein
LLLGKVVRMGTSQAEQMRLLVLNSAIETERAGVDGKRYFVQAHGIEELAGPGNSLGAWGAHRGSAGSAVSERG